MGIVRCAEAETKGLAVTNQVEFGEKGCFLGRINWCFPMQYHYFNRRAAVWQQKRSLLEGVPNQKSTSSREIG